MEHCHDTLEDMHANQHIPQIIGAIDMFTTTGEQRYWNIAKNFWDIVTKGHIYCIGGVGETEMFHRAGTTCHYLTEKSAESCASYNLLRLTGEIFSYLPEGKYMDYYDNTSEIIFLHLAAISRTAAQHILCLWVRVSAKSIQRQKIHAVMEREWKVDLDIWNIFILIMKKIFILTFS